MCVYEEEQNGGEILSTSHGYFQLFCTVSTTNYLLRVYVVNVSKTKFTSNCNEGKI